METDDTILRKTITDLLEEVTDVSLLDLISKILIESIQASPQVPNT